MKEGLLKGKKGIIFGALNEKSIALASCPEIMGTGSRAGADQLSRWPWRLGNIHDLAK